MKLTNGRIDPFSFYGDKAAGYAATLQSDKRLYKHDIMGSIAHVTMLAECGIIESSEADILQKALTDIFFEINEGKTSIDCGDGIFSFVENRLREKTGDISAAVNKARSYEDRLALDIRMYLRESSDDISAGLKTLIQQITYIAEAHQKTLIPLEGDGVKLQPTSLAHILLAFAQGFLRDLERLSETKKRINVLPAGAVLGTGTTLLTDKKRVASLLNFESVANNTLDAVSDTDYIKEFGFNCSLIMSHMEKICNTLSKWADESKGYIKFGAQFASPSSVPGETTSALLNSVTNSAVKSYFAVSSIADKASVSPRRDYFALMDGIFAAEDSVKSSIDFITELLPNIDYSVEKMNKAALGGFSTAYDLIEYLVEKGETFEDAYSLTDEIVQYCRDNNKRLDTIDFEIYKEKSELFEPDIIPLMRIKNAVRLRKREGEPGDTAIRAEIRRIERKLNKI